MKNNVFKKDLYRYYGDKGESFIDRILRPCEIKYIYLFRKAQSTKGLINKYYKLRLRLFSDKTHTLIPPSTEIGPGFYIGHHGRVLIDYRVKIGSNVNVATNVSIGPEKRGKRAGVPTVGNDVWIGTSAIVVGNVSIGNNVLIAPLTFVNFDVPDNSIVIGNPGRIIPREDATEGYINNRISVDDK